jgi:hypothetical protein
VIIVFVVFFLNYFTFVYSRLASTTGRNEVNFKFLNTQFQPSQIVFKYLGGLRLKIFISRVIMSGIENATHNTFPKLTWIYFFYLKYIKSFANFDINCEKTKIF